MNKVILQTILKLYGLIARLDGLTDKDKDIAKRFLAEHASDKELPEYTTLLEQIAAEQLDVITAIKELCLKLRHEIPLKQKYSILAILTELVLSNEHIDEMEEQCMLIICNELQINQEAYRQMKQLMLTADECPLASNEVLIVDAGTANLHPGIKTFERQHLQATLRAVFFAEVEVFYFSMLHSSEVLLLNGLEIEPKRIYPFQTGSVIRGDKFKPIFYRELYNKLHKTSAESHIIFEAVDVTYYHHNGVKGLENVNLREENGALVAIMGPSGSGKSTLLNVLNGTKRPANGRVTINGVDIHQMPSQIEGLIGYVPQDDLLLEDLTVYENLYFAAELCHRHKSPEELKNLVFEILNDLNLEDIAHKKVGNVLGDTISGGQRKRVNIGLELLRKPAILFSDEPTSGLSSRDSEKIMELHRELATAGKIVFVVIHQPSSDIFKMFDRLYLLDKGGKPIYYGPPTEAVEYFKNIIEQPKGRDIECITCGNVNPEQIFSLVETPLLDERSMPTQNRKYSPDFWHQHFLKLRKVPAPLQAYPNLQKAMSIASPIKQALVFFKREAISKLRNTQFLSIGLLQAPFLALVLSTIVRYFDLDTGVKDNIGYTFADNVNLPTYLFMSVIVSLFTGMAFSAEEIIKDAKIRKRESFLHLNQHSYLLAKILILFIFSALQTALFIWIGNRIVEVKDMDAYYFAILFSTSCFANLLGLNVSASFKKLVAIYIMIPVLLIPQLVLGGIVVRFSEINPWLGNKEANVPILGDLMASRWAFEALAVTQFKDNPYEKNVYAYDKVKSFADFRVQFLLNAISGKIDQLKEALSSGHIATEESRAAFNTVLLELHEEDRILEKGRYSRVHVNNNLVPTRQVLDSLQHQIQKLKLHYSKISARASAQRDKLLQTMIAKYGKAYMDNLRKNYRNNQLEGMVRNNLNLFDKPLVEYAGRFIQLRDPIYQSPEPKAWWDYRTKFYLPEKHFAGFYFSTFSFNIAVIWLMTALLYITLYFELFKRLGTLIQRRVRSVKSSR